MVEQKQFFSNGDVAQSQSTPLLASPDGFVQVYVQSLFMGSHNIPSVVFLRACDTSASTPMSPSPSPSCTPISSDVADTPTKTLNSACHDTSNVYTQDASCNDVSLQDASLHNMVLPIEVGTHEIHSIAYYLSSEQQGDTSATCAQNTDGQQRSPKTPLAHATEHATDGAPENTNDLTPYTLCRNTLQALGAEFARFMIYEVDGARFFAGGVLERKDTTSGNTTIRMSTSIARAQTASLRALEYSFTPQWVETRATDAIILSRMLNTPLFVSREVFLRAGTQVDTATATQ